MPSRTVWDTTLALLFGEEGLIIKAIGFVQAGWDVVWGLVKTAWDTFTGAIQTVWDTTLALLFGEEGLIIKAIGFVQAGVGRGMGPSQGCVGTRSRVPFRRYGTPHSPCCSARRA